MTQMLATVVGIAVPDGGAVETIIATTQAVSTNPNPVRGGNPPVNPWVRISGVIVTVGNVPAGATIATVRCRLGTLVSGTALAGQAHQFTVIAGQPAAFPFMFHDGLGGSEASVGQQYSICLTYTGAVATGAVNLVGSVEALI